MCKKLAIFPVFSIILAILSPKQAFAANQNALKSQNLVFDLSADVLIENGFVKGSEETEQKSDQNSESAILVESAPVASTKKVIVKKQKFVCSEEDLSLGKCKVFNVLATGYSSTVDQCDADPFTTASGKRVHLGTLACNFLPFGTLVKFPGYFGDRIFIVEDRMAKRFSDRMDVWFETRSEAIQFGARKLTAVVITK